MHGRLDSFRRSEACVEIVVIVAQVAIVAVSAALVVVALGKAVA